MKATAQDTPLNRPITTIPAQRNGAGILANGTKNEDGIGTGLHADEYFRELAQPLRESCVNALEQGARLSISELPSAFAQRGSWDLRDGSRLTITPGFQWPGLLYTHGIPTPAVEH